MAIGTNRGSHFEICDLSGHLNYVMLDLWVSNQTMLEDIQKYQSRLRDFSSVNLKHIVGAWPIEHVIADLVAQGANATLIALGHPCFQNGGKEGINWLNTTIPRIFPHVRTHEKMENTPVYIWNTYFNSKQTYHNSIQWSAPKLPGFAVRDKMPYSYFYCTVPKINYDSSWNFSIFSVPFDYLTWLGVLISLVSISLLAHSSFRCERFSFPFLSSFGVLSTGGVSTNVVKYRSKLFVMWMLAALVLVNHYTGKMTSSVIKPPEEEILKTFQDLKNNNFSIITHKPNNFNTFPNIVRILSKMVRGNIAVRTLLASAVLVPDRQRFIQAMVGQETIATFEGWPYAMWNAIDVNLWIGRNHPKNKNRKKCYIGKELLETGERYFTFLPPVSNQLSRIFQKLLAAGIIQRWEVENYGIAISRRVQDRGRVKDRTTMVDDNDNSLAALSMEGKVITIFIVWIVCILCCSTWFLFEVSYRIIKSS